MDLSWICRTFHQKTWTCLAPFGLASLHRTQRCLGPFPRVARDSFPEQVFLVLHLDPCHRLFVDLNFELRVVVGLGIVRHSSHVLYQSLGTLGLLVPLCWPFSTRTRCSRSFRLCTVNHLGLRPGFKSLTVARVRGRSTHRLAASGWTLSQGACPFTCPTHLDPCRRLAVASSGRLDILDCCPTWIVSLLSRR